MHRTSNISYKHLKRDIILLRLHPLSHCLQICVHIKNIFKNNSSHLKGPYIYHKNQNQNGIKNNLVWVQGFVKPCFINIYQQNRMARNDN